MSRGRLGALVSALLILAGGCRTLPPGGAEFSDAVAVERFTIAAATGTVVAVELSVAAGATFHLDEAPHPDALIAIGVTPWERVGLRRRPVGIVQGGALPPSPAVARYWALLSEAPTTVRMVSQREFEAGLDGGTSGDADGATPPGAAPGRADGAAGADPSDARSASSATLAAGAFFPLVDGTIAVADRFPGTAIVAARVAVGRVGDRWAVVAVEGSLPWRRGVTTPELAEALAARGYEWALNVDGGASAWVRFSSGVGPRVVPEFGIAAPLRRRGPVILSILPPGESSGGTSRQSTLF